MRTLAWLLVPALAAAEPATPVVTKRFMRQFAAGAIQPGALVDRETGVLQVIYVVGDGEPAVKYVRRLCGRTAERELARLVRDQMKIAIEMDEIFKCSNRPRPMCRIGILGEFATTTDYVFRPTPDGKLVFDTLITTNSAYKPADEARVVARLRAKHTGGSCRRSRPAPQGRGR